MGDSSESKDGGPARAGSTREKIEVGVGAALLIAFAVLVFYGVLQAVYQSDMVVTTAGWLFVVLISTGCGCVAFAAIRTSLVWRLVAGAMTAFLIASGILFVMGVLLALMSGMD